MSLLIGIPLKDELDQLIRTWTDMGLRAEDSHVGRLSATHFPELNTTATRAGIGKVNYAVKLQHLLDAGGWDLVICAGTAGSLSDEVCSGEIVAATAITEHDFHTLSGDLRSPTFDTQESLLADLRRVGSLHKNLFTVHFGIIASGDEVIWDSRRRTSLHQQTGALVVAMEGAGGARACRFNAVPFLEVRGVTDAADDRIVSHFLLNLETAMHNVAVFLAIAIPTLTINSTNP